MSRPVITRTRNADLGKPQIVSIDKGFRGIKAAQGLAGKTSSILPNKYSLHSVFASTQSQTAVLNDADTYGKMQNAYINSIGICLMDVKGLSNSDFTSAKPMPY